MSSLLTDQDIIITFKQVICTYKTTFHLVTFWLGCSFQAVEIGLIVFSLGQAFIGDTGPEHFSTSFTRLYEQVYRGTRWYIPRKEKQSLYMLSDCKVNLGWLWSGTYSSKTGVSTMWSGYGGRHSLNIYGYYIKLSLLSAENCTWRHPTFYRVKSITSDSEEP